MLKRLLKGQGGSTLVELVVVTAIMGVLASTATPLLVNHLGGAKEQAYNADLEVIQTSVDAWYTDPSNTRLLGKNQYRSRAGTRSTGRTTSCGARQPGRTWMEWDPSTTRTMVTPSTRSTTVRANTNTRGAMARPTRTTRSGTPWRDSGADLTTSKGSPPGSPAWTDDADGVSEIKTGSSDKWTTVRVTRAGTDYFANARYYFMDLAALVNAGFLRELPKSSSLDNSSTGAGSYTYFVDNKGGVTQPPG